MKTIALLSVLVLVGCSGSARLVVSDAQRASDLPIASAGSAPDDPNAEYMKCSVSLHRIAAIVGRDAIRVEFDPQFVESDGYAAGCSWFIFTPDQFGKYVGGCGMDVESAAKGWLREYAEIKYEVEHPKPPQGERKSGLTAKAGACGTTVIVKAKAAAEN